MSEQYCYGLILDWVAPITQTDVTFMQTLPFLSLIQLFEYLSSYDAAVPVMSSDIDI